MLCIPGRADTALPCLALPAREGLSGGQAALDSNLLEDVLLQPVLAAAGELASFLRSAARCEEAVFLLEAASADNKSGVLPVPGPQESKGP